VSYFLRAYQTWWNRGRRGAIISVALQAALQQGMPVVDYAMFIGESIRRARCFRKIAAVSADGFAFDSITLSLSIARVGRRRFVLRAACATACLFCRAADRIQRNSRSESPN